MNATETTPRRVKFTGIKVDEMINPLDRKDRFTMISLEVEGYGWVFTGQYKTKSAALAAIDGGSDAGVQAYMRATRPVVRGWIEDAEVDGQTIQSCSPYRLSA